MEEIISSLKFLFLKVMWDIKQQNIGILNLIVK